MWNIWGPKSKNHSDMFWLFFDIFEFENNGELEPCQKLTSRNQESRNVVQMCIMRQATASVMLDVDHIGLNLYGEEMYEFWQNKMHLVARINNHNQPYFSRCYHSDILNSPKWSNLSPAPCTFYLLPFIWPSSHVLDRISVWNQKVSKWFGKHLVFVQHDFRFKRTTTLAPTTENDITFQN